MIHLCIYVPHTHVEVVKEALFAVGVGRIGLYDRCVWQTEGQGQFRALEGSQPFIGQINQTEVVREVKLELVCEDHLWPQAVQAIKMSHPYQTPAYFGVAAKT
jgi:hypothetical protein